MHTYLNALRKVYEEGTDRPDRTGVGTRSLFGLQMEFDLQEGFPAVTTKKLAFKQVVGELIGFIRGYTSAAQFRELGCNIWDANANDNQAWRLNPNREGTDDLGRIYRWREWRTNRAILGEATQLCSACMGRGEWVGEPCEVCNGTGKAGMYPIEGYETIDQLEEVIESIKADPYGRRHIVSAWNPGELDQMALPPCHMMFQFYARPVGAHELLTENKGYLDLRWDQRSADMFLGVPFNIASYAVLLHLVAKQTGYLPGKLVAQIGDAHIYQNHFDQVREQLRREPKPLPNLRVSMLPKSIDEYAPVDIVLENYYPWPALTAPMAV